VSWHAKPLVLVACCGPKLDHAAEARDIYVSDLFKKARAFAERQGGDWLILSAKHGVIDPTRVIEPYDQRPPTTRAGKRQFAHHLALQLVDHRDREIIVLAGEDYCGWIHAEDVAPSVDGRPGLSPAFSRVRRPLKGMGIGQQKAWLKNAVST
jgi:hypothetical protein